MKIKKCQHLLFISVVTIITSLVLLISFSQSENSKNIHIIQLNDDSINPVTAEYIAQAIDQAEESQAVCLIIKLDTPGGLLSSTRLIVKKMLTSQVPIVVYISPSGSRAGSAGVFITYASHIAAMAPSTNIGAAHPVQIGQQPKGPGQWDELKDLLKEYKALKQQSKGAEETEEQEVTDNKDIIDQDEAQEIQADADPMSSKILQDTVAFIKAIAFERQRNVEWAIESVTKSSSITDVEALEKGVIEIIAKDDKDLINQLDGQRVVIQGQEVILETKNANIIRSDMDVRQKFFNILANPNIAYFLMILGFYGLLFEVTHPGIGVPGVLGAIFLILAFYSMQTLPTNYAGLALVALGLVLLVAEAFVPGFGLLTLGGVVCMILGSMLLFESTDPIMRVSHSAIYGVTLTTAAITFFLIQSVIRTHRTKVHGGKEGLIGEVGEAECNIGPGKRGKVYIRGELWNAKSSDKIHKGDEIEVEKVKGLTVFVKKHFKKE